MNILASDGTNLLAVWLREQTSLRVELVSGNVHVTFTGVVTEYSAIEMVVGRGYDEMSISLFCAKYNLIEPSPGCEDGAWRDYRRVVQVETDGGAQCTIHELRK